LCLALPSTMMRACVCECAGKQSGRCVCILSGHRQQRGITTITALPTRVPACDFHIVRKHDSNYLDAVHNFVDRFAQPILFSFKPRGLIFRRTIPGERGRVEGGGNGKPVKEREKVSPKTGRSASQKEMKYPCGYERGHANENLYMRRSPQISFTSAVPILCGTCRQTDRAGAREEGCAYQTMRSIVTLVFGGRRRTCDLVPSNFLVRSRTSSSLRVYTNPLVSTPRIPSLCIRIIVGICACARVCTWICWHARVVFPWSPVTSSV